MGLTAQEIPITPYLMKDKIIQELRASVRGEVKDDLFSKRLYSIDASIYQLEPTVIVQPRTREDVIHTVRIARNHGVPVIPRGAGTGLTGGCLGEGIILDVSRFMNRIIEVDYDREIAVCEPGVIQDQLNAALADRGYRLGPDTSTGNRATLGGMLGNNASGTYSMHYGKMVDNVIATELISAAGDPLLLEEIPENAPEGSSDTLDIIPNIRKYVSYLRKDLKDEIHCRYPKIQRRVSGYNLDELVRDGPVNLARLAVGSEGTLGIATSITVKISKRPATSGLILVHFSDLLAALDSVGTFLEFQPYALELIDSAILGQAHKNPEFDQPAKWMSKPETRAILIVELSAESDTELRDRISNFTNNFPKNSQCLGCDVVSDARDMATVWRLRKASLGLLMARRANTKAIAFLEDMAVPPDQLGSFVRDFREYTGQFGTECGIYGHAGAGCIHIRPMLDLRKTHDVEVMVRMMEDISDLAIQYGGAISGEHGDGLVRSWLNEKLFGPKIYGAFREIKSIFDPENIMNPGKIINGQRPDANLRVRDHLHEDRFETFLDFSDEGGIKFATEMCNGNGECRKLSSGVMCPSFQLTRDEQDSTRGRAQSLIELLNEKIDPSQFSGDSMYKILDLCLQCKACKRECPSQIDMAKLKSEFLYHYHLKNGVPIRDRIFGAIDILSKLGSLWTPAANSKIITSVAGQLMDLVGIDNRRAIPKFADQTFSDWYDKNRTHRTAEGCPKVLLFIDTFTQYNYPAIGKSAIEVLDALGYDVAVSTQFCCGKPLHSKGLLPAARRKAARLVRHLLPFVEKGYTIVGLEPSCTLSIKDDYPSLLSSSDAQKIAAATQTIDTFLDTLKKTNQLDLRFRENSQSNFRFHGHCHQKAIEGTDASINVLQSISGCSAERIDSGCCGMAGTFGYEKEHYKVSLDIGEARLFPAIRECSEDIEFVANGVSCRQQIEAGTGRTAKHLIEVVADHLDC